MMLVQYSSGTVPTASSSASKEEVADIKGDTPSAKRLRRSSSDALQDIFGSEEFSLYGLTPSKADSTQVKFFILIVYIHKSIYFLSWKEQGAQLNLLAKDFGSLDCFSTEVLIDGSTLSLVVSDEQKNVQGATDILLCTKVV